MVSTFDKALEKSPGLYSNQVRFSGSANKTSSIICLLLIQLKGTMEESVISGLDPRMNDF